jgi:hypothetical protein
MVAIGCSGDQPDHRHGQGGQPEQGGRLHGYEPVAAKTPTNIQKRSLPCLHGGK